MADHEQNRCSFQLCFDLIDQSVHLAPLILLCLDRFTHLYALFFADFTCHSYQHNILEILFFVSCMEQYLSQKALDLPGQMPGQFMNRLNKFPDQLAGWLSAWGESPGRIQGHVQRHAL